jgi:hypothetical protein
MSFTSQVRHASTVLKAEKLLPTCLIAHLPGAMQHSMLRPHGHTGEHVPGPLPRLIITDLYIMQLSQRLALPRSHLLTCL